MAIFFFMIHVYTRDNWFVVTNSFNIPVLFVDKLTKQISNDHNENYSHLTIPHEIFTHRNKGL